MRDIKTKQINIVLSLKEYDLLKIKAEKTGNKISPLVRFWIKKKLKLL